MAPGPTAMTGDAGCALTNDSLVDTARQLRDLHVGVLPIWGEDKAPTIPWRRRCEP